MFLIACQNANASDDVFVSFGSYNCSFAVLPPVASVKIEYHLAKLF